MVWALQEALEVHRRMQCLCTVRRLCSERLCRTGTSAAGAGGSETTAAHGVILAGRAAEATIAESCASSSETAEAGVIGAACEAATTTRTTATPTAGS